MVENTAITKKIFPLISSGKMVKKLWFQKKGIQPDFTLICGYFCHKFCEKKGLVVLMFFLQKSNVF